MRKAVCISCVGGPLLNGGNDSASLIKLSLFIFCLFQGEEEKEENSWKAQAGRGSHFCLCLMHTMFSLSCVSFEKEKQEK